MLMYHSVTAAPNTSTRPLSVDPTVFEAQLAYLRSQGFTGLTFGQLGELVRSGRTAPPGTVVLTFDDGYADFFDEALPSLVKYGFPATVFVTTGWVRDTKIQGAGSPPGRMMSWSEIEAAPSAGIEIAAHSATHLQLDQIQPIRLRHELSQSKQVLEDHLGRPVVSMAYPYGYSSRRVRGFAAETGYLQAAAVANSTANPTSDPFKIPRLTVRRSTSLDSFARIVNGDRLGQYYAPARALTAGWAAIRLLRRCSRRP